MFQISGSTIVKLVKCKRVVVENCSKRPKLMAINWVGQILHLTIKMKMWGGQIRKSFLCKILSPYMG